MVDLSKRILSKGDELHGIVPDDMRLEVEEFDDARAELVVMYVAKGLSRDRICEILKVTPETLIYWSEGDAKFAESLKRARELRREVLLDKSFNEDVLSAYEGELDGERLDCLSKRADLVNKHLKTADPKVHGDSGVSVNIDLREIMEGRGKG